MVGDYATCDRCEQHVHLDELDFKPERFDRWWWLLLPTGWANWLLTRAADRGEDFDGGYCGWCFGPGYRSVKEERN